MEAPRFYKLHKRYIQLHQQCRLEYLTKLRLGLNHLREHQFKHTRRENCPYAELFWSVFSRIRTKYGEILNISPYSVKMGENADQNNSEHGHFLRSDSFLYSLNPICNYDFDIELTCYYPTPL